MRTPSAVVSRTIASATARASVGPGQRREHDAGPALLHLHRRRPHVERAGRERARGGVGHELAGRVVEVRLDHDHLAAGVAAGSLSSPTSTRTMFGTCGRSRVPAP